MSFIAVAIGGSAVAGIGGALISSNAAKNASNQQAAQGAAALAQQQQALTQQNALFQQGVGLVQPFIDKGNTAGSTLQSLLTPGPNQTATLSQIPGFQFAQDWGQKAIANQATTTGMGGNQLKAGADYATGAAQSSFGTLAQLLLGLTNTGAGAAGSAFGNATQTGANIGATANAMGGTLTGIGNAQAAGTLGSANALAGGLGGLGNSGINSLLLNKLLAPSGAGANPGIYSANTLSTLSSTSPGNI